MYLDRLLELAEEWRTDSTVLQRRGAPAVAEALATCAAELEAAIYSWQTEELSIKEASRESGYSQDHLRELVRTGQIHGAGSDGHVRVRRGDLPRRPGAARPRGDLEVVADLAAELIR